MSFILSLIVFGIALYYLVQAQKKLKQLNETFRPGRAIATALVVIFGLIILFRFFTVIPAGHVGVQDFFGTVSKNTLKSGINVRNPLARIVKFSIKTQQEYEDMLVPSKEGLTVKISITALYHLDPEKAAEVYKTVGENYQEVILIPQFRSVCRGVTATYEAKALYTSQREVLARTIWEDLEKLVADRGIIVESTPLRNIELPAKVTDAIEDKLKAEQESQRMEFILTKEKQEAERKRIEAKGISDFQNIVAQGISEPLLRWKGIEATEKLATSPNAKVVIVGAGRDGLPVILDTK
ncbi:prohibitin family protein [bacterium]|nr:prohibitin family protein [bacterium]